MNNNRVDSLVPPSSSCPNQHPSSHNTSPGSHARTSQQDPSRLKREERHQTPAETYLPQGQTEISPQARYISAGREEIPGNYRKGALKKRLEQPQRASATRVGAEPGNPQHHGSMIPSSKHPGSRPVQDAAVQVPGVHGARDTANRQRWAAFLLEDLKAVETESWAGTSSVCRNEARAEGKATAATTIRSRPPPLYPERQRRSSPDSMLNVGRRHKPGSISQCRLTFALPTHGRCPGAAKASTGNPNTVPPSFSNGEVTPVHTTPSLCLHQTRTNLKPASPSL